MPSSVQNSRTSTPNKATAQPPSRPSTPSNGRFALPGEKIDKTVVMTAELAKLVKEQFTGAECVFGTNAFELHFVRIYSSAGDILVYDMYTTQTEAMTGAKTALEVIAELRKPKNTRNNNLLKNVQSNFYLNFLVDVDKVAHGATVTRTLTDDDHQNIQITLPATGTGKPVVLTAGPKDYMNVIKDAREALYKHLKITTPP